MGLGMAGIYLSLGFLLNAVAPLVLFLPVFAVVHRRVIRWEERQLAAKFGSPYLDCLSRVPRWFNPRPFLGRRPKPLLHLGLRPFRPPPPAPEARGRPGRSSGDEFERPGPPS
jgi:hypothetical protein